MEKRIELEKRGRRANQIVELNLDNCRSTNIVGLTDEFTALESLSLINVGLTTLKGFPKLPNLKKLELSDNRISNGLNHLTTSPKLSHLNLSGNKIKDLETLKPLEAFQNLEVLDLFNNEATNVENYREKIFAMFPSLKYLDGFDANEVEASSDGDDDDEVNGNDSEDEDDKNVFSLNGIEIDLQELEKLEEKIKQKKGENQETKDDENTVDELDEYLENLKLKESEVRKDETVSTYETLNDIVKFSPEEIVMMEDKSDGDTKPASFASLLYAFTAILHFASVFYSWGEEDEDSDDTSEEGSDEDERGDVSLAEVYNSDIEEDNSDWGEENEAEEMNDDDEEDEEDSEGEAEGGAPADGAAANNQTEAETPAEESQARGKKRKYDG